MVLYHKAAHLPIDVQEVAVIQQGRTSFAMDDLTYRSDAMFSACTALPLPCQHASLMPCIVMLCNHKLSGDSRLSKLKRESRLEHLQAQQKDMLLQGDLGSMAIRFPDAVDRFFCTVVQVHRPLTSGGVLGFRLTTSSAFPPAGCRQRSGCFDDHTKYARRLT